MPSSPPEIPQDVLDALGQRFACNYPEAKAVFPQCIAQAMARLDEAGVDDYLEGAALLCLMGRGAEPVLIYLENGVELACRLGREALLESARTAYRLSRSPNAKAIVPFLQSLPAAAERLGSLEGFRAYLALVLDFMERTTGSIHGFHATQPSPGLPVFLERVPQLLELLSLEGLKNWVDYGIRNYPNHPDRQRDYFGLHSADSHAVLQRERHGTLFADHQRRLELYLRALWHDPVPLVPYSQAFHQLRKAQPYMDAQGIRLPDVLDTLEGVSGLDQYRLILAHLAAHRRWSGSLIADNLSPFQRLAVETFEDARIDRLLLARFPGLAPALLALHPTPREDACDESVESCIRHRLACLSRAILDPDHPYRDAAIRDFAERARAAIDAGADTQAMAELGVQFIARTRRPSDSHPKVHFQDTEVPYRDDNRHLWRFIEEGDEEEAFEETRRKNADEEPETAGLPPIHYPEWDYRTRSYRPHWVSLYESLHPAGDAGHIDRLLERHRLLAKRLERLLDRLKPQDVIRQRYQEDGLELDLDVAIRALIDLKTGHAPDPRIDMIHRHDGRNIAVTLLVDLSASLADPTPDGRSVLELAQEAVSLLAWAVDRLGDPLAIAGFHSDTRHNVRYLHLKGFSEPWGDTVKARLAAMEAGFSTRMGAALRHAGHRLAARPADKRLLLILTDGEPSDIDVDDPQALIHDAHKAVQELHHQGVDTYCINLDRRADDYIADIFGHHYTIIDRVERLPEKLPLIFAALTG